MGVKRGYHVHMRPKGNARLGIPVLDAEVGYMMVPMANGIRLTSGAEFAHRDSPPTPRQIDPRGHRFGAAFSVVILAVAFLIDQPILVAFVFALVLSGRLPE